jgi:hypothetical protein
MHLLRLDHFAGQLNETFHVDVDHSKVAFVLVEARPLPHRPMPGALREPFSLLFRNASPILFPQRTYTMGSARMAEFGIFLVPVARDKDGFLYQAVFN